MSPRLGAPNSTLADALIFMMRNFERGDRLESHRASSRTLLRHFPEAHLDHLVQLGILRRRGEIGRGCIYWIVRPRFPHGERVTRHSYSKSMERHKARNARVKEAA